MDTPNNGVSNANNQTQNDNLEFDPEDKDHVEEILSVAIAQKQGRLLYANSCSVITSLFDFQLSFETSIVNKDNKPEKTAGPLVIIVSPQRAKKMLETMLEGLKQYEQEYGEINL